jgi:hypothetical protein
VPVFSETCLPGKLLDLTTSGGGISSLRNGLFAAVHMCVQAFLLYGKGGRVVPGCTGLKAPGQL